MIESNLESLTVIYNRQIVVFNKELAINKELLLTFTAATGMGKVAVEAVDHCRVPEGDAM